MPFVYRSKITLNEPYVFKQILICTSFFRTLKLSYKSLVKINESSVFQKLKIFFYNDIKQIRKRVAKFIVLTN